MAPKKTVQEEIDLEDLDLDDLDDEAEELDLSEDDEESGEKESSDTEANEADDAEEADKTVAHDEQPVAEPPKRKRGRPPKAAAQAALTEAPKRRGRPPKQAADAAAANAPTTPQAVLLAALRVMAAQRRRKGDAAGAALVEQIASLASSLLE